MSISKCFGLLLKYFQLELRQPWGMKFNAKFLICFVTKLSYIAIESERGHTCCLIVAPCAKNKLFYANKKCFVIFIKIIQKRRRLLESMTAEKEFEDSIVCEDKETGKTFTFRKQKGKLVDFLDVLLQTKVGKILGYLEMVQERYLMQFKIFVFTI